MSWLGWGSAVNPQYEELVEKSCSPLKLPYPQGEDIALNLEITDMIRSKTVLPKPAMQSLKRRVASKNGRVQMYALGLIDTCIKNGGDHFLAEIASKEFVDEMTNVIKSPLTNAEVKQMTLQMFQQWALAFQSKKDLSFFVDVYNELKNSGIKFPPPPAVVASSLLETSTAPQWVDSDVCMRCRSAFTFTNRKHHCRNCGLVYDQACSSRQMALPKFGIKEEVRVCESCWIKAGKNKPAPAVPGRTPRTRQDFDADLQRAIELSLAQSNPGGSSFVPSEPPLALKNGVSDDDDEQMRLAIEASLREMERVRPSAPTGLDEPEFKPLPTFDLTARETETILTFSNTLDQMAAYGERDLRRFPHAHVLYEQAYALGNKLQRNGEEKTTKQQMLAEMQAKLAEAVALYGSILDGQQTYAARKAQEQQRQYQGYYAYQPQPYAPQAAQGYGHNDYYAAQGYGQVPQSLPPLRTEPAPAAPSLYPSMPPTQAAYQPYAYAPSPVTMTPTGPIQNTYPAYPSQWQAQPGASHQPSYPQEQQQQQQHYEPPQQYYAPEAQAPGQHLSTAPAPTPSAPPPVDMASHPSMSPRSTTSVLHAAPSVPSAPARSASYASPQVATAPLASSPIATSPLQAFPPVSLPAPTDSAAPVASAPPPLSPLVQSAPMWPPAQSAPVLAPPAAATQNPWQQAQPAYTASMFPSAPEGGLELTHGLEKQEREEALLIEL